MRWIVVLLLACRASPPTANVRSRIDAVTPWIRTVITPGASAGPYRGADGVSRDSEGCWVTAWEEGGAVTRACMVDGSWATELVASGLPGVEDAKAADLDGDGIIDVVSCSDSGGRCYVTFRGAVNSTITLTESMGRGRVMQAAIADVDADGLPDVVFGSRVGSPAVVAWLKNPGVAARDGSAWTYQQISLAGWVMSLIPIDADGDGDMDVIVTDRAKIGTSWALYGLHWKEQQPGGVWVDHPIGWPAGSCATCTPGDQMFASIVDHDLDGDIDIIDCTSTAANPNSRIVIHRNQGGFTSWTHEVLPPALNVGHCQSAIAVPGGIAVTTWKANALPMSPAIAAQSGVYWLRDDGGGLWTRGEISGSVGGKFDNAESFNECVITSEQLDPAGGAGVVMFCPEPP